MITALHIGNFKAFGPTQTIPIKPLTLIYGPNSGGKSSIIHALALAHEARRLGGNWNVSRTGIGGNSIDLGGFYEYVHRHDTDARLVWGATVRLDGAAESAVSLILRVGLPLDDAARPQQVEPCILEVRVTSNGNETLRMLRQADGRWDAVGGTEGASARADVGDGWPAEMAARLTEADKRMGARLESGTQAIGGVLDALAYLGPIRSVPPRHLTFALGEEPDEPNFEAGGGSAWAVAREDDGVRASVNAWLGAEYLRTPYELRNIGYSVFTEEQLQKRDHEQWYAGWDRGLGEAWGGNSPQTASLREQLQLVEDRSRNCKPEQGKIWAALDSLVRARLTRTEEGEADITPDCRPTRRFKELRLFDRARDTLVSHRDVGVGISQVLPVLVNAYGSQGKLIAIEQPEIHLHPALQAELGDLFIESALGERKNTFIIETHSEHLLLRIMRRMRETATGTLPPKARPVRPSDISLLYVDPVPDHGHSVVQSLPLDDQGDLVRGWPGGFFEEGLREVF